MPGPGDINSAKSPPLHVHVDEETPVHLHIKKGAKKSATARSVERRLKDARISSLKSSGNLRPTPSSKGPWVPAPGRTTKGKKFVWQGDNSKLSISPPEKDTVHSTLRMEDLDEDEEDRRNLHYEKKIDSLMSEVGTLKSERELAKSRLVAERVKDELQASRRVIEEQEEELNDYKAELEISEMEKKQLRKSIEKYKDDADFTRKEKDLVRTERGQLLKKLVEADMDSSAAVAQVDELRDIVRRLREEKQMTSHDSKILAKQRELLLQKLQDFEQTNHTLRSMLREQHKTETSKDHAQDQRDVLLRKLTESEAENQRLRISFLEKEREAEDVRLTLESEREQSKSMVDLQASMESTKAHLQNQLRKREGDCNRMAVQIRNLENQIEQERLELDHVKGLLQTAKEKSAADKDALKRATRVQKDRATRSEDAVERLNAQLMEKEAQLTETSAMAEELRSSSNRLVKEKAQLESSVSLLTRKVEDMENTMKRLEMNHRNDMDNANSQIHSKSSEVSSLQLENERLKTSLSTVQDKLTFADTEAQQLKSSIKEYESMVGDIKSQMSQSKREALDATLQLEQQQHIAERKRSETISEMERVRGHLEQRLKDLEPLPEMLRSSEQRLLEATEKLLAQEEKSSEQAKLISEITIKIDHQSSQLETIREKWHTAQDENRTLLSKLEILQRRLDDAEDQVREMQTSGAKKDETIHQTMLRLEEKTRENTALTRQLEQAISDSRRIEEEAREKAVARERNSQARILDLESQLSRSKSEILQIKRQKEDTDRKSNSQIHDLKDRLEQSHSTNRSMQNYVQFLKNSYSNVFGETSLATSPYRSKSPAMF